MTMNTLAAWVVWLWVAGWTLAALRQLWCGSNRLTPCKARREDH